MLLLWGFLLCTSTSGSADRVLVRSGENLTLKCSTTDCLKGLSEIEGAYKGMYLYRDHQRLAYYDYEADNPSLGQFSAYNEDDTLRIVKSGSFEEHNITIINVTDSDSGFYSCTVFYFIKYPKFKSSTSCNAYRVGIVRDTDPEVSAPPCPEPERPPAPGPFLVIVLTATVSVLLTMTFTLCLVPKIKQCRESPESTESTEFEVHSNEYVYEEMTRNGFRPVSDRLHRPAD